MTTSRSACAPECWFIGALVAAAIVASVFFQGFEPVLLCAVVVILLAATIPPFWHASTRGLALPRHALPLALLLLWCWFALTLLWHPVVYLGVYNFWWLGALPLAFVVYWNAREHPPLWPVISIAAASLGAGLTVYALVQFFVLNQAPRSVFININSHAALLNLILLPAIGYFLGNAAKPAVDRRLFAGLLILIALLAYGVALSKGRGPMVSLTAGLVVITAIAWRKVPVRVWVLPLAVCLAAFVAANLTWQGQLAERYSELADPVSANSMRQRFLIWDTTWQMLKETPLWGIGIGMFGLLYAGRRSPEDSSAGFLVHNDYLQLWLEAGLPALILAAIVAVATLMLFVRTQRPTSATDPTKLEFAGLFAGVLAVSLHSLIDFNYFVLTILILVGLALARMLVLYATVAEVPEFRFDTSRVVSGGVYRLLLVLSYLFPLVYTVSVSSSIYYTDKGVALAAKGDLLEAERALIRASKLYPYADNILVSQADLYRYMVSLMPPQAVADRRWFYQEALSLLDRAERLNRYRPLNHLVRGRLYAGSPDLAREQAARLAAASFERALALNPRFHPARVAYAELLLAQDKPAAARALLERGMAEHYLEHEGLVPFYLLIGKLRRAAGDETGAEQMRQRIKAAMAASGWRLVPLPENARVLTPPPTGATAEKNGPDSLPAAN